MYKLLMVLQRKRLPCSESDTSLLFLIAHCPSMLPVVEKAQQEPHIPYNIRIKLLAMHFRGVLVNPPPPWLCFSTCQGESLTKQWTYE